MIRGSRILAVKKLTSEEIYDILIFKAINKPSYNLYYKKLFQGHILNCESIYSNSHIATYNTYMCSFQCNILNNVLFLNKKQYPCIITNSLLCSFVESINETPLHLFYECNSIKSLWNKLCIFFHDMLILPL